MATTSHFQTQKSFFVVLSITLTSFLLLLNKVAAESTSFTFNNFVPDQQNLILQGNALVTSKGMLQLTKVKDSKPIYDSLGRALYSAPVHIWDKKTGNVASFATAFTFVINAPDKAKTADGLAFFLAPVDTQPQKAGGLLGLFPNRSHNKSSQTVAVEFDTFYNQDWDPEGPHIGIDVNSIKSRKTTPWDLANGEVAVVVISYLAPTKSLTVSLVYPLLETSFILDATVDLKAVLPEWVRVGFSASTGLSEDYVETHDVLSWSFQSELPDSTSDALQNNAHLSTYVLPA